MGKGKWWGLLVVIVVVASCSSAEDSAPTNSISLTEAAEIAAEEGVDAFAITAYGTPDLWADSIQTASQATAECMRDQGWVDFLPMPGPVALAAPDAEKAYSVEFGYGVSTDFFGSPATPDGQDDPNAALYSSMSNSERLRYDGALSGATDDADGCFQIGHRISFGNVLAFSEDFRRLQERTTALMASDRRVIAAEDLFGDCMNDAGYQYRSEEELVRDLIGRLADLTPDRTVAEIPSNNPALVALRELELAASATAQQCLEASQLPAVRNEVLSEIQLREAESCPACWAE